MIDTKALRQKILDMAIRGKLVPQDPNDEPASVLLERIREEKQRLIKEGKIKKDKNDSVIFKGDDNRYYEKVGGEVKDITDDLPFEIPDSWSLVRLSSVCWLTDAPKITGEKLPYLDAKTLRGKVNTTLLFDGKVVNAGTKVILVDGENSGEVFEIPFRGYMGSTFKVLEIVSQFNTDYLNIVLEYYQKSLRENKTGSAIPHLNKKLFKSLLIGVPSLYEQLRITDRINELFKQIDIIEQNQADISTLYDEFRKRTLTLAIQGKLVPQDENDEPANVLLERIRAEKKAKLGKKYVDSYIYKGDDNCYYEKVGETVTNISNEIPFDLPENWSYSRLETMITLLSGRDLEPNQYNSQRAGIPYITGASNIEHGSLIINRWTTNSATISRKGDLLITCKGTVGTMALNNVGDIHIARQIMAINADGVCLNYIRLFLESHVRVLQNKAKSFIPGISRQDLLKAIMPIPPFNEQLRIVEQYKTIYKQLKDED